MKGEQCPEAEYNMPVQHYYKVLLERNAEHINSGHPVRYYCRCQCLGSSHMVILRLELHPSLCGNKKKSLLKTHLFKVAFTDK